MTKRWPTMPTFSIPSTPPCAAIQGSLAMPQAYASICSRKKVQEAPADAGRETAQSPPGPDACARRARDRWSKNQSHRQGSVPQHRRGPVRCHYGDPLSPPQPSPNPPSEEHTSELQSPDHLVCRLLLEKKKQMQES